MRPGYQGGEKGMHTCRPSVGTPTAPAGSQLREIAQRGEGAGGQMGGDSAGALGLTVTFMATRNESGAPGRTPDRKLTERSWQEGQETARPPRERIQREETEAKTRTLNNTCVDEEEEKC